MQSICIPAIIPQPIVEFPVDARREQVEQLQEEEKENRQKSKNKKK